MESTDAPGNQASKISTANGHVNQAGLMRNEKKSPDGRAIGEFQYNSSLGGYAECFLTRKLSWWVWFLDSAGIARHNKKPWDRFAYDSVACFWFQYTHTSITILWLRQVIQPNFLTLLWHKSYPASWVARKSVIGAAFCCLQWASHTTILTRLARC